MKSPVFVAVLGLLMALLVSCVTLDELVKDQEPSQDGANEFADELAPPARPMIRRKEAGGDVAGEFDGGADKGFGEAGTLVKSGRRFLEDGDFASAIGDFSRAISINPELADAYYYRATAYDNAGEYERAVGDFNKTISINPSYVRAYFGRGSVYVKNGETDKAIDDFAKACDMKYTPACEEREKLTGVLYGPVFQGGKISP